MQIHSITKRSPHNCHKKLPWAHLLKVKLNSVNSYHMHSFGHPKKHKIQFNVKTFTQNVVQVFFYQRFAQHWAVISNQSAIYLDCYYICESLWQSKKPTVVHRGGCIRRRYPWQRRQSHATLSQPNSPTPARTNTRRFLNRPSSDVCTCEARAHMSHNTATWEVQQQESEQSCNLHECRHHAALLNFIFSQEHIPDHTGDTFTILRTK